MEKVVKLLTPGKFIVIDEVASPLRGRDGSRMTIACQCGRMWVQYMAEAVEVLRQYGLMEREKFPDGDAELRPLLFVMDAFLHLDKLAQELYPRHASRRAMTSDERAEVMSYLTAALHTVDLD